MQTGRERRMPELLDEFLTALQACKNQNEMRDVTTAFLKDLETAQARDPPARQVQTLGRLILDTLLNSAETAPVLNGPKLSTRERECLLLLAQGLRTAQIADRLGIATVTVELYCRNARKKLAAKTREQAVALAIATRQVRP